MNLIEQLGGYERAKYFSENVAMIGSKRSALKEALLEYRRANNIFDVGDLVVYKPKMVQGVIFKVIGFDDFGWMKTEAFFDGFDHAKRFSEEPPFSDIKHATPQEIEAGHRL